MRLFLGLLLVVLLSSCFGAKPGFEQVKEKNVVEVNTHTGSTQEVDESEKNDEKNYKIAEKEKRFDITPEDIDNLYLGQKIDEAKLSSNPVLKNGANFINGLKKQYKVRVTENVNGGIDYSDYEAVLAKSNKDYVRDLDLYLKIKDYKTGKNIESGTVYLNNIKFGEFKDGVFEKNFKWPIGIEKYVVMVKSSGYGYSFINIDNLNNDGTLVYGDIFLKKVNEERISLSKDAKIGDLDEKGFLMEIPKCSLVDSTGKCYSGDVTAVSKFISGKEVNSRLTTLNMRAVTDEGEHYLLYSGGMAFSDFVTPEGEILRVGNGKKIKVTYKLTDEDIKAFSDLGTQKGSKSKKGYWWYDKDSLIWREGKSNAMIDEKNKLFIAEVERIY